MLDNVALKDLIEKSGDARRASGGRCVPAQGLRDERAGGVPGSGRGSHERGEHPAYPPDDQRAPRSSRRPAQSIRRTKRVRAGLQALNNRLTAREKPFP